MRGAVLLVCLALVAFNVADAASGGQKSTLTPDERRIMRPLFGKTLAYFEASGFEVKHETYGADHTWMMWVPRARPTYGNSFQRPRFRGTWDLRANGLLCVTYHRSNMHPHEERCSHIAAHHVGDAWASDDGQTVTLLAGIQ